MTMPPLPEPLADVYRCYYTEEHMKDYAISVLEAAAQVCEEVATQYDTDLPQPGDRDFRRGGLSCAAAIRAMKESRVMDADAWAKRSGAWSDPRDARIKQLEAERDALKGLLYGFTGPAPSPVQWKMICDKAAELRAHLDAAKEKP